MHSKLGTVSAGLAQLHLQDVLVDRGEEVPQPKVSIPTYVCLLEADKCPRPTTLWMNRLSPGLPNTFPRSNHPQDNRVLIAFFAAFPLKFEFFDSFLLELGILDSHLRRFKKDNICEASNIQVFLEIYTIICLY